MPITDTDRILIEKNLDNNLTKQEQIQFNQRLSDPAFAEEVWLYAQAKQAILVLGDKQLKSILQEEEAKLQAAENAVIVEKTVENEAKTIKNIENTPPQYFEQKTVSWTRRLAIAASFLLLASAAYFLWEKTTEKPSNTEGLFANNFKPYPNFEKPIVRDEAAKNDLENAFSLYEKGAFEQSLAYFEKITPPQYPASFLQANAYLAVGKIEKAIPILEKLSQATDFDKHEQAEWFLALALSKTDKERSKAIFRKMAASDNHSFKSKAQALLATEF